MIISHRHKFIFIKNRKVAGTSVELALQAICGENDILTPDHIHTTEHDVLKPYAKNYEGRFNPIGEIFQSPGPYTTARVVRDFWKRPKFYNHIRASSVRARIPREIWDSYYKFTFERNPWDKALSFYYWFGRNKALPSFNDFIQNHRNFGTIDQTLPTDWTRYTLQDTVIVDDVFDYNNIEQNLKKALRNAFVPAEQIEGISLSNQKGSLRQHDPILLEKKTDQIIQRYFAKEIEHFPFCQTPKPGLFI